MSSSSFGRGALIHCEPPAIASYKNSLYAVVSYCLALIAPGQSIITLLSGNNKSRGQYVYQPVVFQSGEPNSTL